MKSIKVLDLRRQKTGPLILRSIRFMYILLPVGLTASMYLGYTITHIA